MEMIEMIDYGDAYNPPEAYYVKEGNFGKVYSCPKPKQNLSHINEDSTLGGTNWTPPGLSAPMCPFNTACANTPISSYYNRVIPWDHKRKDYVYGAAQDAEFKGFYDRRSLKSRIDLNKNHSSWDPVSCYNLVFWILAAILAIAILVWIICMIVYWNDFYTRSQWPWWVFWLVVLIMIVVIFMCIFRCGANARAKKRYQRIHEACADINKKNLHGTGTYVYPGEAGAWLEVEMDPRRTMISGPVRHDRWSSGLEQDVHVVERKPVTHHQVVEQVIVNSGNGEINSIAKDRYQSVVPDQVVQPINNGRMSEENVYSSGYNTQGPADNTQIQTSGREQSFYQKLKAKKMAERESEFAQSNFESYATPVNASARDVNSIGVGYSSVLPQQN